MKQVVDAWRKPKTFDVISRDGENASSERGFTPFYWHFEILYFAGSVNPENAKHVCQGPFLDEKECRERMNIELRKLKRDFRTIGHCMVWQKELGIARTLARYGVDPDTGEVSEVEVSQFAKEKYGL